MCIYKQIYAWLLDLALHLQSTAQMKLLDAYHFFASCMKKKHHVIVFV